MELSGEEGLVGAHDTLIASVRSIGKVRLPVVRKRSRIHRKTVVLWRDVRAVRDLVDHGLVLTAISERQLVGLASGSEGEKLVTQTDTENGLA